MKRYVSFIITFIAILSINTISLATYDTESQQHAAVNPSKWAKPGNYSVSESGTLYSINYIGENGVVASIDVFLEDGQVGSGGMNGYGSIGSSYTDQNPVSSKDIDISADDIVATLMKEGTPQAEEAAKAIANRSRI